MNLLNVFLVWLPKFYLTVTVIIIIIIIIILIIINRVITFMWDIYKYIPETNNVSRVYNVAAVLYLHLVLHVMLLCP